MSEIQIDVARAIHAARADRLQEDRRASQAVAVRRLQRRADRLAERAERFARRADRAASRARLAVARPL